ncbi:UvrD-helicase domain-containing protein [Desulfovibrio aerotolerans]|uniref:DNA 3'-5' helicase n=1 Tax=Solidesulfovibrio aerotolerans TaxID=295255 RepID=A0A7C9MW51_9BACT|nr:UvrD-helicase domain-containing protein [Solidesulfovibrio aerotolerans]MYL84134.1 UvrD-helicase domain-containing protein [Solidesulfovibrio aerotolerans]
MLIQVKASAGSGKTHALTNRFLSLVLAAGRDLPRACGDLGDGAYAVPDILAVTFTNKAAAEMRERVIEALKKMALGQSGGASKDRVTARRELESLLIHAQRLNIRTIDSLLYLMARVFALELGLRPDFEPCFDDTAILSDLYDRLAAGLPADPGLARQFGEAAAALFSRSKGFLPTLPFREQLLTVAGKLLADPACATTDPEALRLGLTRRMGALQNAAGAILLALDTAGLVGNAHFLTFLRKCRDCDNAAQLPTSTFVAKESLAECLLKASRDRVTPQLERLFAALTQAYGVCRREAPVLLGAMGLAPFLALARRLAEDFPGYLARMRKLPQSQWARLVTARLAGEDGVPDAWCRMGSGLAHMLIDEFQDTSRSQWAVLRLLALESLACGGSLYLVGDVKQAIYSWRGGDAALFDEAPADPELCAVSAPHFEALPHNWRSAPAIVGTNNRFFAPLAEPAKALEAAEALLGSELAVAAPELAAALGRAFSGAGQEIPPSYAGPQGHVRVTALPGESTEEYDDAARETLLALLRDELLPRHGAGGVAVLTRTNPQAGRVASWLVDAGIEVVTENSLRLADHPLIRQLAALLAFLDYPPDSLSFWAFVSGQELFGDLAGITRDELTQWLAGLPGRASLSLAFKARWPDPWQLLIKPYLRQTGLAGPYDILRSIVTGYRLIERRPGDEAFIRRFLEIAHLAENDGRASISAFLEFWNENGEDEKVPQPENAGAVRVMTIHKAKGLQFPAVVVPYHHFHTDNRHPELVTAILDEGTLLVPDQPGLGEAYARRRARDLAEQIHLLYVAWTRPELELHAFVPGHGPLREGRRYPLTRVMDVLFAAFGTDPAEGTPIRIGAPTEAPPANAAACAAAPLPAPAAVAPQAPLSWLPRLKVYRNVARDIRDAMRFTEKRRGELAHAAAETFVRAGFDPSDPEPAARKAVGLVLGATRLDPGLRARLAEEFAAMLLWLAGLDALRPTLAAGFCERDILAPDGQRHRPDLFAAGPQAITVADFKTGQADASHDVQVRRYLDLLRHLPDCATVPAKGWLVYLDRRECCPVEYAS